MSNISLVFPFKNASNTEAPVKEQNMFPEAITFNSQCAVNLTQFFVSRDVSRLDFNMLEPSSK
jgi:hypothetical protein